MEQNTVPVGSSGPKTSWPEPGHRVFLGTFAGIELLHPSRVLAAGLVAETGWLLLLFPGCLGKVRRDGPAIPFRGRGAAKILARLRCGFL